MSDFDTDLMTVTSLIFDVLISATNAFFVIFIVDILLNIMLSLYVLMIVFNSILNVSFSVTLSCDVLL